MNYRGRIYTAISEGIDSQIVICELAFAESKKFEFSFLGVGPQIAINFRKKIENILLSNAFPINIGKYTFNLLPADTFKNESSIDLPMALLILAENDILPKEVLEFMEDTIFVGELSLDGEVFPVKNALSLALNITKMGKKRIVIPHGNLKECSLLATNNIFSMRNISDILNLSLIEKVKRTAISYPGSVSKLDFDQVYGQEEAKRAIEIAVAGRHNIMLYGSPGSGKTMIAQRVPSIMIPLSDEEIVETTRIYSSAGLLEEGNPVVIPPFRRPHHSVSPAGLIGGGVPIYPGEISLAHNGVLFMDEFLEFSKKGIESLRECIEERKVHLKRGHDNITYPASFITIAAFNPCHCGFFGESMRKCTCSLQRIKNYMSKMSGPLIDRIDLQVNLKIMDIKGNNHKAVPSVSSSQIRERIKQASRKQFERNGPRIYNALVTPENIEIKMMLSSNASDYIQNCFDSLNLSMRSYHKIIKVSRTIADIGGSEMIEIEHLKEALSYRSFEATIRKFNVI